MSGHTIALIFLAVIVVGGLLFAVGCGVYFGKR